MEAGIWACCRTTMRKATALQVARGIAAGNDRSVRAGLSRRQKQKTLYASWIKLKLSCEKKGMVPPSYKTLRSPLPA